jgi:nucleotide-binding universal stress UspA family protein
MRPSPVPRSAVVVGVDASPASRAAVDWAADEAARHGVPLHVLHAFTIAQLATPGPDGETADFEDITHDAIQRARRLHPDLRITFSEPEYAAASALVDASRIASMVVVGSRGHGAAHAIIAGSVSVQVAAQARCPVVVLRIGIEPRSEGSVVVGIDGSEYSRRALRVAFQEASARGARLVAVHAWTVDYEEVVAGQGVAVVDGDQIAEQAHADAAESIAGFAEEFPDVDVERVVLQGDPADIVLDHATDAQMVVVGSRGRGLVRGFLLGSVSQAVMHRAICPVLVVRDRESMREDTKVGDHGFAAAG